MSSKTLPTSLYNDLWLDCIQNNLIGVLASFNQTAKLLPCQYNWNYRIESEVHRAPLYFQFGHQERFDCSINVVFDIPDSNIMNRVLQSADLAYHRGSNIQKIIHELLRDNYYVFIQVDRYYFPNSMNFEKGHFVHPTFIYGYNDELCTYHLIEDCEHAGVFKYYDISYSDLEQSIEHTYVENLNFVIKAYRIREGFSKDLDDISIRISPNELISSTRAFLEGDRRRDDISTSLYGISALQYFTDRIKDILIGMEMDTVSEVYPALTRSQSLHKKNILLLTEIQKTYSFDKKFVEILQGKHLKLIKAWLLFSREVGYFVYKKQCGMMDVSHLNELSTQMANINNEEIASAEAWLQLLGSR